MDSGYFANISGMIPAMDPTYAEDFWSRPGYLGTDPASTIGDAWSSTRRSTARSVNPL